MYCFLIDDFWIRIFVYFSMVLGYRIIRREIVEFHRGWTEFFHILGYYAVWGALKPTFRHYLQEFEILKMSPTVVPKRRFQTTLRHVMTQKTEQFSIIRCFAFWAITLRGFTHYSVDSETFIHPHLTYTASALASVISQHTVAVLNLTALCDWQDTLTKCRVGQWRADTGGRQGWPQTDRNWRQLHT